MKKKIFAVTLLMLLFLSPINLSKNNGYMMKAAAAANSRIQPYSNQTGYKYVYKDGKLWKRLWSYTYKRWEEPHWTLA
ncbi:MAG: hypothetical protein HFH72_04315 [Lachnospiraceae bacterium]|nr:hypothetical protein [Lachnospiraceae bacterium]